jgi:hypothetical protein
MATNANRWLKPRVLAALAIGLWMLSESSSAACLLKPRQVEGVGTIYTLMLAPEAEVGQYTAFGFGRVTCPADMRIVREYVERLCDTGRSGTRTANPDVLIGRSRELACASARAGLAEAGG